MGSSIYREFIEAVQTGDVICEDNYQLLFVKAMSINESNYSDKRATTELRGNSME